MCEKVMSNNVKIMKIILVIIVIMCKLIMA
jgi:hypothetical protein